MRSNILGDLSPPSFRAKLLTSTYALIVACASHPTAHGSNLNWQGATTDNVWTASSGGAIWVAPGGKGGKSSPFADGDSVTFDVSSTVYGVAIQGTVAPSTLTIDAGTNYSFAPLTGGSIQASGAITISGTLTLSATSSVNTEPVPLLATSFKKNGLTVNNGGSLILAGTGNHVGETADLRLAGGTLAIASSGISETFGALTLTGPSTLDFSGTGSSVTFTSISGSSALNVFNFDPGDRLFLAQPSTTTIYFYSGSDINSPLVSYTAEVVPEPSTILGGLGMIGFLGWRERRRIASLLKRDQHGEVLSAT